MGTDIHAFIEVDYGKADAPFESNRHIAFSRGELFVYRDYDLFDALGNGRTKELQRAMFPSRGLPPHLSAEIDDHYFSEAETSDFPAEPRPRTANPDWRLPSWLYLDEIHAALSHAGLNVASLAVPTQMILELMAGFERKLGPRRTRLVFWFDN